ncbi:hypothetical protein ACIRBY_37115 [Streptomyces sp. NPDC096136]|uniref:hypothetical protein n=1 Tax=Streptomyces sp. NPDC096136 TaxID=3366076 RepID=UPI00381D755C
MAERVTPRRATPQGGKLKRGEGKRDHVTKVLMNDEEFAKVQGRAIALQVSVPRTLVEAATGVPPLTKTERHRLYEEVMAVRRLLGNATNNLNQVAKALNSDGEATDAQISAILRRLAVAVERTEDMARKYAP